MERQTARGVFSAAGGEATCSMVLKETLASGVELDCYRAVTERSGDGRCDHVPCHHGVQYRSLLVFSSDPRFRLLTDRGRKFQKMKDPMKDSHNNKTTITTVSRMRRDIA
jgi:hypothetical protein